MIAPTATAPTAIVTVDRTRRLRMPGRCRLKGVNKRYDFQSGAQFLLGLRALDSNLDTAARQEIEVVVGEFCFAAGEGNTDTSSQIRADQPQAIGVSHALQAAGDGSGRQPQFLGRGEEQQVAGDWLPAHRQIRRQKSPGRIERLWQLRFRPAQIDLAGKWGTSTTRDSSRNMVPSKFIKRKRRLAEVGVVRS